MIPTDTHGDPTPQPSAPPERWILIYDADCGFCRWSLARVLALDRAHRLRPVALGTPEADALLADMAPDERAASWHLVSPVRPADIRRGGGATAPAPAQGRSLTGRAAGADAPADRPGLPVGRRAPLVARPLHALTGTAAGSCTASQSSSALGFWVSS